MQPVHNSSVGSIRVKGLGACLQTQNSGSSSSRRLGLVLYCYGFAQILLTPYSSPPPTPLQLSINQSVCSAVQCSVCMCSGVEESMIKRKFKMIFPSIYMWAGLYPILNPMGPASQTTNDKQQINERLAALISKQTSETNEMKRNGPYLPIYRYG